MNIRQIAPVVIALSFSVLAGCSSAGASSMGTSGAGASGGDGGAAPNGMTCSQVLTCTSNQNCTTNDCIQGCIAQGTPDAQTVANALDTCYQTNACQDAACLQTKCGSQLSACASQGAGPSGGATGNANAPRGSIPASFVGTWTAGNSFDSGAENAWTFNDDGSATYAVAETSENGSCTTTTSTQTNGAAVIDSSTITLYPTTSTTTQVICGTTSSVPEPTATMPFTYTIDSGGALIVIDATCAAQYPGQNSSINLYCTQTYRKQ